MINRILHEWSFHMKFMKLAEGSTCVRYSVYLKFIEDEMNDDNNINNNNNSRNNKKK